MKKAFGKIFLPFGLLMALMAILGNGYVQDIDVFERIPYFLLTFFAKSLMYSVLLYLLCRFLPALAEGLIRLSAGVDGWFYKNNKKGLPVFLFLYVITGVVYLITFLAVYPGVYSYDASVQVLQVFGREPLTSHHPLLHTAFFCGLVKLGQMLTGSYQAGLALHSVVQAAIMGAVFSYAVWRMIIKRRPVLLVLFTWLFLVLNPYIRIFVFVTTKDVLFCGAFLLLFLFTLDMLENITRFFSDKKLQLRFFLTAVIMCLLRNQGIYVFVLFCFIYLIYLLKTRKTAVGRWLGISILVMCAYGLFIGPFSAFLGVERGDVREMLSVPMQQLARAYQRAPEKLSLEERKYIEALIAPENLEQYVSVNADPVKSGFRTEVMRAAPGLFLKNWLSVGAKDPRLYLDSFLMGNWGYWYPKETQYWIHYIEFDGAFMDPQYNILNIRRNSKLPQYENHLREISLTPAFEDVPVLSVLLNQGFPLWLMLITAAVCLYFKKYRILLPLLLFFGYFGTLLLGPVTAVRYALPLMVCVPDLFLLILEAPGSFSD